MNVAPPISRCECPTRATRGVGKNVVHDADHGELGRHILHVPRLVQKRRPNVLLDDFFEILLNLIAIDRKRPGSGRPRKPETASLCALRLVGETRWSRESDGFDIATSYEPSSSRRKITACRSRAVALGSSLRTSLSIVLAASVTLGMPSDFATASFKYPVRQYGSRREHRRYPVPFSAPHQEDGRKLPAVVSPSE